MLIIKYKSKKTMNKIALFLYRYYYKNNKVIAIEEENNEIILYTGYFDSEIKNILTKRNIKFKKE